ncbi:MAG: hypothetical protein ACHQ49_00680 [Elusimicrobiota bacterium]
MTPAASGGRAGLGWAILVAALAVPGFLFYNWWSHLKAESDHSISTKASKRADGEVFQTPPPMAGRLTNPMTSSTAPVAAAPGAPAAPFPPPAVMPGGRAPAAAASLSGGHVAPRAPLPAAGRGPIGGLADLPVRASTGTSTSFSMSASSTVVLSRDPTMSPMDLVRLREAALADEEAHRPRPTKQVKHKASPIEDHIDLQGIVGEYAIINDAKMLSGHAFSVKGYPGKVKISKISATIVTLEYGGRTIKLRMKD